MPVNFSGKWMMVKHGEISNEMMDTMGIPAERRPNLPIAKLEIEIVQEGDKFTIKSMAGECFREYSFEIGTTFETSLVSFLPKMSVSASWEGDKLLFTAENDFKMHRELQGDQMVTTVSKGDVSFQVFFNKA